MTPEKENSTITMLLAFYMFQHAEDLAIRRAMFNMRADGGAPYLHRETKQRHNRMLAMGRQLIEMATLNADRITEEVESMAKGYDEIRGMANAVARMTLALYDRFGNDYRKAQEFVDEFLEQTGGRDHLTIMEKSDMDWFIMRED